MSPRSSCWADLGRGCCRFWPQIYRRTKAGYRAVLCGCPRPFAPASGCPFAASFARRVVLFTPAACPSRSCPWFQSRCSGWSGRVKGRPPTQLWGSCWCLCASPRQILGRFWARCYLKRAPVAGWPFALWWTFRHPNCRRHFARIGLVCIHYAS